MNGFLLSEKFGRFLEHVEGLILLLTPIVGAVAVANDFSWTNLILFLILMLVWKIANGALN